MDLKQLILCSRAMALFLWEHVEDPIPSALAASWLYGAMADQLSHNYSDLIEHLHEDQK